MYIQYGRARARIDAGAAGVRAGARATGGGHTFFQESCMYISPLEKKNFSFSVNAKNDRVLEIWIPKQKLKRTGAPVLHRNWVEY